MKKNNGFTLVEALLAMTIVIFIVVSILSGFMQQMVSNRYAGAKNIAISLAESKIEEYLKFPASQMPADSVDYVVERGTAPGGLDRRPRRQRPVSAYHHHCPLRRFPGHEHGARNCRVRQARRALPLPYSPNLAEGRLK